MSVEVKRKRKSNLKLIYMSIQLREASFPLLPSHSAATRNLIMHGIQDTKNTRLSRSKQRFYVVLGFVKTNDVPY
jgi:hypothetical protein